MPAKETADADNLNATEDAIADVLPEKQDSQKGEEQTGQESETSPASPDDTPETLTKKLTDLTEKLQQKDKDYRELQGHKDRQYNQLKEQMAKLEGMVQVTASVRESASKSAEAEASAKKWKDLWAEVAVKAEEHPKEYAPLLEQFLPMMKDEAKREAVAEVSGKLAILEQRLQDLDPATKGNKATIDLLVGEGMAPEAAKKVALAMKKLQGADPVRQPGDSEMPGRTADAGRKVPTSPQFKMPTLDSKTAAVFAESCRMLGLNEAQMKNIVLGVAKEQQG